MAKQITEAKLHNILSDALLPISAEVANIHDQQKVLIGKVEKNYKYLFGNGEAGLDERGRMLEKNMDKLTKTFSWVGLVAGGYLIVEIVKMLLSHL